MNFRTINAKKEGQNTIAAAEKPFYNLYELLGVRQPPLLWVKEAL